MHPCLLIIPPRVITTFPHLLFLLIRCSLAFTQLLLAYSLIRLPAIPSFTAAVTCSLLFEEMKLPSPVCILISAEVNSHFSSAFSFSAPLRQVLERSKWAQPPQFAIPKTNPQGFYEPSKKRQQKEVSMLHRTVANKGNSYQP